MTKIYYVFKNNELINTISAEGIYKIKAIYTPGTIVIVDWEDQITCWVNYDSGQSEVIPSNHPYITSEIRIFCLLAGINL